MPDMILWLKCGSDATKMSGDPYAHYHFFRMLLHASKNENFKFSVKTYNPNKLSKQFRETGLRRGPAITSGGENYAHEDEIYEFLDQFEPRDYSADHDEAEKETSDLFKKFAWYIKAANDDDRALNHELLRLDRFLRTKKKKFLVSDELSIIDTLLLPRIHSMRIAGEYLKGYAIPEGMHHVWNYLRNGYTDANFRTSCPSDQEIILHWAEKPETPNLDLRVKNRLATEEPRHSFFV